MSEALVEKLNDAQREAVTWGDGPLLVLAGAGSGKTRVITHRIAYLCQTQGVTPRNILAVTFTNKAAGEMKERVAKLLGGTRFGAHVSTFHSFGATLLRREAEELGLSRGFVIYDQADSLSVVKRAMKEVGVAPSVSADAIAARIDAAKNDGLSPTELAASPYDPESEIVAAVYLLYEKLLRRADAVDFDDLILLPARLFAKRPDVLDRYRARFRYVLVDEFQDTNAAQYQLLRLLTGKERPNLCVVGDDDQAIYRWRGADVRNILSFEKDFPGTKVVRLEQNYRSDAAILDAAYAVISRNPRRKEKRLWTERDRGAPLLLLYGEDEREEARQIARGVSTLADEGLSHSDMAVFFRINAQSRAVEEIFRLSGIPYAVVRGRAFYDRAEIKDAIAYLRLMVNPRSEADLLRVLNVPARGLGSTTEERFVAFARTRAISLYDALALADELPEANAAARSRLKAFRELVDRLQSAGTHAPDAATAVNEMLNQTGLLEAHLAGEDDDSSDRAENLRELIGAAAEFDRLERSSPLMDEMEAAAEAALSPMQAFLERVSLLGDADEDVGSGRVSLMTLHAAKGLEFEAVFLAGMEDGVFPHARALRGDDLEEMAEERRLCYVGITRAKRRLFLSLARRRYQFGEGRYNEPSRFLSEIPQALFAEAPPWARFAPRPRTVSQPRGEPSGVHVEYDEGFRAPGSVFRLRREEPRRRDPEVVQTQDEHFGRRVYHETFGSGVIRACRGDGPNAKVDVYFENAGLKVVIARFLRPA
jgi:DNA helicase II / ATP-dependent DNA helicase PcrA